jgi:hypothetical protein
MQRWCTSDLVRRLCHALDIADHAIERLAAGGYTDPREPSNSVRPEKLLAETGLLLLAASTARHPSVDARIAQLARRLIPHARSDRMLLGMSLQPAVALEYAQAHICLGRIGHRDAAVDQLLRESARAHARAGRERPPHRMLEQEWTIRGWMTPRAPGRKPNAKTAGISILNHPMDLLTGGREDVYAFTHALMYVSDFNLAPCALPRPRSMVLEEAEAALARCLDDQDYDLAGEVLLAWPLTGTSWTAAGAFGFRVLASVEDAAGFLPAPSTRLDRLAQLQGGERSDYLLATAYHTAYVMGLLCAAALQPRRAPPRKLADDRHRSSDGVTRLLAWLDAHGPRPHWRDELERLDPTERAATTSLLFNVVLRRAVDQRAFAELPGLLELGLALDLAGTPAARQAEELLSRLAIYDGIRRSRARTHDDATEADTAAA